MDISTGTNEAILAELGGRLRRERLNADLTREQLAEVAGVSAKTIQKIERGDNSSMQSWLGVLRGLNLLDRLEAFLPEVGPSPVQLAKLRGKERQRASGRRGHDADAGSEAWQW